MLHESVRESLATSGRSSTPAVKGGRFGLSLGKLVLPGPEDGPTPLVLVVGDGLLFSHLASRLPPGKVVSAIPGVIEEQAMQSTVGFLIVDEEGMLQGRWSGIITSTAPHLAEQVFEAGRMLRARGALSLFVSARQRIDWPRKNFILSTTQLDFANIPEVDLEEGAPQSEVWNLLTNFMELR